MFLKHFVFMPKTNHGDILRVLFFFGLFSSWYSYKTKIKYLGGQQILISILQVYSRYFQVIFLVFPGSFTGQLGVPEHIRS